MIKRYIKKILSVANERSDDVENYRTRSTANWVVIGEETNAVKNIYNIKRNIEQSQAN